VKLSYGLWGGFFFWGGGGGRRDLALLSPHRLSRRLAYICPHLKRLFAASVPEPSRISLRQKKKKSCAFTEGDDLGGLFLSTKKKRGRFSFTPNRGTLLQEEGGERNLNCVFPRF